MMSRSVQTSPRQIATRGFTHLAEPVEPIAIKDKIGRQRWIQRTWKSVHCFLGHSRQRKWFGVQFVIVMLMGVLSVLLLQSIVQAAPKGNLTTATDTSIRSAMIQPSITVTISVHTHGVTPSSTTIARGTQITWVNNTSRPIQISNQVIATVSPYNLFLPLITDDAGRQASRLAESNGPQRRDNTDWISDLLAPGESYTRAFDTLGVTEYYVTHLTGVAGVITVMDSLERIRVSPSALLLTAINESHLLAAEVFNTNGELIPVTVSWHSTHPDIVSVDESGRVRALAQQGSAFIYATVDGLESPPVTVLVAKPTAGAHLVTDEQIAAPIQPVDMGGSPGLGVRYRTTLRDITAPPIGAMILSREGAPLAGKVVATTVFNDRIEVEYISVPITEIFDTLHFDENLDRFSIAALLTAQASANATSVRNQADGSVVLQFAAGEIKIISSEAERATFAIGPFECESSATPVLTASAIEITFANTLDPGFAIDIANHTVTRLLLKLEGEIRVTMSGGLTFSGGFKGDISCRYQQILTAIPINGALAALITPVLPAGLGFDLESDWQLAQLGMRLEGSAGASMRVGFDYRANQGFTLYQDFEPFRDGQPTFNLPNLATDNRIDASLHFFGLTGLGVSIFPDTLTGRVTWNIIDVKFGPQYVLNGAPAFAQATDPGYASNYALQLHGKAGAGQHIEKMINYVSGTDLLDLTELLNFAIEQNLLLAESPHGAFGADRHNATVGEPVALSVQLDPTDLQFPLIGYNIKNVTFYRMMGQQLIPLITTPASAGQSSFQTLWTPTQMDSGVNRFYAFASSNSLPNLPLEVTKNSALDITIEGSAPTNTPQPPTHTPTPTPTSTPTPIIPGCLAPDAPGQYSPVGVTVIDNTPTLRWEFVADYAAYQLQIEVAGQLLYDVVVNDIFYTIPTPLANGIYSWRIRSIDRFEGCNEPGDWSPARSFTIDTLVNAVDVVVNGTVAYVAAGNEGLQVIDVSDPGAPVVLGSLATEYSTSSIYAIGTMIYLTDNSEFVYLIDATDPTQPELLSIYSQVTDPEDIFVTNNTAYVVSNEGDFDVVDVSNPRNPLFLSQVSNSPLVMETVFVSGNIAYVDDEGRCELSTRDQCGIRLVDVSNRQSPSTLSYYNTPGSVRGIFVTAGIAYLADGEAGVQLVNVANPTSPAFLGRYQNLTYAHDLFVVGNRVYVAAGDADGLVVIDAATPSSPKRVTAYDTPGSANSVFVTNNTAYVADGAAGLFIQPNVD